MHMRTTWRLYASDRQCFPGNVKAKSMIRTTNFSKSVVHVYILSFFSILIYVSNMYEGQSMSNANVTHRNSNV